MEITSLNITSKGAGFDSCDENCKVTPSKHVIWEEDICDLSFSAKAIMKMETLGK